MRMIFKIKNKKYSTQINTNASKEKNTRMCLVDKKGDYLDFLTFMELFSQLPNDANIVIILGLVYIIQDNP